MAEDGFDDNGWSRFLAPNIHSNVDPPNEQCELIQESLTCVAEEKGSVVEKIRGAKCMLRAEGDGNEIDLRTRKAEKQRKVRYLEGFDALVDVERSEKNDDILPDQSSLYDARVTQDGCQRKVDPPNTECDLLEEHFASGTEKEGCVVQRERGAEYMLRAEDHDFGWRKPEKQTKIEDLEGYDASVTVERRIKDDEIPQAQALFRHCYDLTLLNISEANHAVPTTEWFPFDPSSSKEMDEDEHSTKEKTVVDEVKTATGSTFFKLSPLEEDKDKNSIKEVEEKVGDQGKAPFEGTPFPASSLENTDKDKNSSTEEKTVANQAEAPTETPHFGSLSLKEKEKEDKDKHNTKKSGKAARSRKKNTATYSSHVGFLIFENTGSIIFRSAFQSLFSWISSTCLEKDKVTNRTWSCYGSLLSKWLKMENENENNTREVETAVVDWPKATTKLCYVDRIGSPSSKSHESKSSKKSQTAESTKAKPEFLSKPVKLLNSWSPVLLSLLISVLFQAVGGTLVVAPKDVIGLRGEEIRLRCSSQFPNTVYWERILVGSREQQSIYFGINGMVNIDGANGRIKIDSDPATGRYDLVIKDLQAMDAATYICIGDNGIGEEKRAQLIVIDYFSCHLPMPNNGFMGENTVNLPVENIQASCSLQYYGHVTPRIEWRLNNIQINASHANNGTTVKSMVTLRGTKELNGANLSSLPTVSAAHDSENDTIAWWTSAQLKVNYIHLELGEVAECQTDSAIIPMCVPSCEYQQVEILGDELCYCVAVYNMDGANYNITFNKHPCYGSDSASKKSLIIITVCATVFGLLIAINIISIIVIKRRSTCKRSGTPPGSEEGLLSEQNTLVKNETPEEKLGTNTKEKFVASASQIEA